MRSTYFLKEKCGLPVVERPPLITETETKWNYKQSYDLDPISLNNIHLSYAVLDLELLLKTTFTFFSPFIKIHSRLYSCLCKTSWCVYCLHYCFVDTVGTPR